MLIFGVGQVGTGAYKTLLDKYGEGLLGIDQNPQVISKHVKEGKNVITGDVTDYDFLERLCPNSVKLILLGMPNVNEALIAVEVIKNTRYGG